MFFASDESGFVNAVDLVVDGGIIGGRHWSVAQEGYKQIRKTFGVTAEG